MFIRQNIAHWFDYATPSAIQERDTMEWNTGAMVLAPNSTVFDALLAKLPEVRKFEPKKATRDDADGWNSKDHDQGFLSSFFTLSKDPTERMKTMSTGDAVLISSLQTARMRYFWLHRNHVFSTVHLTTAKPWGSKCKPKSPLSRCKPKSPVVCDVLREWGLSVRGLGVYELPKEYRDLTSSTPAYLENCPTAATPVIPAYLRFPRAAPEPKGPL